MITKEAIRSLEILINESNLDETLFPVKKGNSICIKNYRIYQFKNKYVVKDVVEKEKVAETFSKAGALAIAKSLAKGKNSKNLKNDILNLDKRVEKNFFDALFYRNIIQNTKDVKTKEIRTIRLACAIEDTRAAKNRLDDFIFSL